MVLFNYSTKELTAKVVYYGPGLCGKTTNLQWIHEKLPIKNKGKMLSLATETDRTLFFDFLPIELGSIRGMRTRIQLYTVPGQVFYNATRRMVLKGADCVVFVVDSQEPMLEANAESFENLRENLEINEIEADDVPMVIQYNKRDLPNALPIEILNERLNPRNLPTYEAVAVKGLGVEDTLKGVTGLVFRSLATKYGGSESATPAPSNVATAKAAPLMQARTPVPEPEIDLPPASPEGAEELLSSLQLDPAPDAGTLDLSLPTLSETLSEVDAFSDVAGDLSVDVAEEDFQVDVGPELEPPPLAMPRVQAPLLARATPAPAPPDPRATMVKSADEAAELRRRIQRPLGTELYVEPETIEDLQLEPEPAPLVEAPVEAFDVSLSEPEFADPPLSAALGVPRPGGQTLPPPFEARKVVDTAPAGSVTTAPISIDVPSHGGSVEVAIPIEVRSQDGSARVQITLRLSLDLKLQK